MLDVVRSVEGVRKPAPPSASAAPTSIRCSNWRWKSAPAATPSPPASGSTSNRAWTASASKSARPAAPSGGPPGVAAQLLPQRRRRPAASAARQERGRAHRLRDELGAHRARRSRHRNEQRARLALASQPRGYRRAVRVVLHPQQRRTPSVRARRDRRTPNKPRLSPPTWGRMSNPASAASAFTSAQRPGYEAVAQRPPPPPVRPVRRILPRSLQRIRYTA